MEKLIKENIIYIIILVAAIIGGIAMIVYTGNNLLTDYRDLSEQQQIKADKEAKLNQIIQQKNSQQNLEKKESKSGKVIYEVLGQQFSPEASFGIMFENILANMTNSGLRIRSIDYNYSPSDDKILQTNMAGYNACELSFVTVSSYTQLQNFFKNLTKEKYLTSITEIYIEPYDRDKTILIARFKVRLYTKTI